MADQGCSRRPRRVVLLGAGGHARVCAEVITSGGDEVVGVLAPTDGVAPWAVDVHIGSDDDLERVAADRGVDAVCIAIGHNAVRRRWSERVGAAGLALFDLRAPSAVVSVSATLGAGVQVFPGAIVNPGALVGDGVILNTGCIVEHDCAVGDHAHIAPGSILAGAVSVGAGALVGVGARVAPGVRVGARSIVGAGAVVVSDVSDDVTVVGVPAREVAS